MWSIRKFGYRIYHIILKIIITLIPFPVPKVLDGSDSILKLPEEIKKYRYKKEPIKKVLIVTGPNISKRGMLDPLYKKLNEEEIDYEIFNRVVPDTSIENVYEVKETFIENNCQAIIAFGGGSPMDCAKAAAAVISYPKKELRKMEGYFKVPGKIIPLFAVPTTSGTGSEGTVAAVIKDREYNRKIIIGDPKLVPKIAVLDPKLSVGLPAGLTASTGLDALTHAVEAYIGLHLIKATKIRAEKATKMIFENLETACNDGKNIEARSQMARASFYAGLAFTRSSVGYVHNIAHQLGGIYGVPHGQANAIVLPYILQFYGKKIDKRLAMLAKGSGLCDKKTPVAEAAKLFRDKVDSLNKALNIPDFVKEIEKEDIPLIAKRAVKEGNPASPVPKIMKESQCVGIISRLVDPQKQ